MIESPVLTEFVNEPIAKKMHRVLATILQSRFGIVPPDIAVGIEKIIANDRLDDLMEWATRCPDLEAFRKKLTP